MAGIEPQLLHKGIVSMSDTGFKLTSIKYGDTHVGTKQ